MQISQMYVGKPVRITDPTFTKELSEDGKDLYGIIWDIEEDSVSGYCFCEVLVMSTWEISGVKVLYPIQDYVEGFHLEEVIL